MQSFDIKYFLTQQGTAQQQAQEEEERKERRRRESSLGGNERWHADHLNAKAEVRFISAEGDVFWPNKQTHE